MIMGEIGLSLIVVAVAMGIANIVLLMFLIKTYWKTYKQVKSGFTIGLLYFSSFLLLQNIVSTIFIALLLVIPLDVKISEFHGTRLPLFLINLVQLVALSILVKITRE
jgi:type III secretory pathway component EscR